MRVAWILLWSSVAVAQPGTVLTPIDLEDTPAACLDLAKLADSPSRNRALSARIALATCLADERVKPIALCDCEQAVRDVEAAIEPSLTLLDEVFGAGDSAHQVLARHAQGELLASLAQRLLATVPPPIDGSDAARSLRELRLQMLHPLVDPWQVRARSMFGDVDRIARANPRLERNVTVASAVRASRSRLTQR